ncbi:MAG: TatD family hydrolase [Anaerolineae bacterium]|jgi:TatD DNase family protein
MVFIDSHAHVDFPQFDTDRDKVVKRARDAGLVAVVNVGTNLTTSRTSVRLAERYDFVYATVGIHPHDAETATDETIAELRSLAQHRDTVAIGEIGLDYYRDYSPRPAQRRAFRDQLTLASELGRPVVIHGREAHGDVFAMLRDWEGTGVLHTYAAGLERLDLALDMGFFIGLSGPVTYSTADQVRSVAKAVPLDRLLIETDCPYLTPEPHRGERNEPAYVRFVAEAIAQERGTSIEQIADSTTENARRLFGLPAAG